MISSLVDDSLEAFEGLFRHRARILVEKLRGSQNNCEHGI
jgi:hypothetical protein